MFDIELNRYVEGGVLAALGVLLLLFGLPSLAMIPKIGKDTTKKKAILILLQHLHFFVCTVLIGASIAIRVLIHHFGVDFNFGFLAIAFPAGVGISIICLLFYRLLMFGAGFVVGMFLGGLAEAGLSNLIEVRDEHEWGKLITLTIALTVGFILLKAPAKSAIPRAIFGMAGSAFLVISVNCFDVLPDAVRLPSILPHVRFIPEIAETECAELALEQMDVYKFGIACAVVIAIPTFFFKFLPWVHRKLHCTVIDQDGLGLRIRFRPNMAEHERQGLLDAVKEYKKEKRAKSKKDGDKDGHDDDNDEGASEMTEEQLAKDLKARHSISSTASFMSTTSGRYIDVMKLVLKKEDDRIEQLGNKFEMFNKQREKMLQPEGDDDDDETDPKSKPPPGIIDWKRGTPDKVMPAMKILATRMLHFFIMGWGAFWIIWLIGWGHNWNNFIAVLSWFGFTIAEIVNYFLGLIYNLNFWTANVRKRKSIYSLIGFCDSVKAVRVDTCIFHYKEDPNTTQKTLQGCLMMKRTPNVHLTHRICDDSFGQSRSAAIKAKILKEKEERGEGVGAKTAQKSKTVLEWIKAKGKWCMGGRCNLLPCGSKCCCSKKKKRGQKKDEENSKEHTDLEMTRTQEDDFSDDDVSEDEFDSDRKEPEVSQAEIDAYPFPEFDSLFYPLPEFLKKEDLQKMKKKKGSKRSSCDSESVGSERGIKKVGDLGWDYDPTDQKGKEIEDEGRTGECDEEEEELHRLLGEDVDDRVRNIYLKNKRILRALAFEKDENGVSYDFEPSSIGRDVVMRVMETMEIYLGGPVIPVLHMKEEMFREDCSRGSLTVTFELKRTTPKNVKIICEGEETQEVQFNKEKIDDIEDEAASSHFDGLDRKDKVKIVARIKPPVHHNKAGNINNVLYNTELFRKGQFLAFFDNDMRPEPDFLIYTLPWFYTEVEDKRYAVNDNVSFIQTPQLFVDEAIADGDKLCNANKIFFNAIQPGRDGENACAFAGTNAIFSKRALLRIGGIPYESQTEDAHTSIRLHKDGFVSYYINLPLVVGEAPMTVAGRLLQFLRWVKGSIQLWWAQFYQPPKKFIIGKPPPKLPKHERPSGMLLTSFAVDTMTWPLSAISALIYMFCALVFVYFGEPPLEPQSPFSTADFLWVFLPYLCFRMLNNWIALQGVKSSSIWAAQEVWYAQAFTAFLGILDALYEKFMGKGMTGWRATGEGTRTSRIEYFNIIVLMLLVFGIIIRFVLFLASSDERLLSVGSAFFAAVILVQLWPMVSMSLYELIINEYRPAEEKKELGRFKIPNWLMFTVILVAGISVGVLMDS